MSRVFVIQNTRFPADVSPAKVYGNIEYILGPGDRTSSSPELSLKKLGAALDGFDAEVDYILWAGGDPLSCMLTGAVLMDCGITRFKYLRFEKDRPNKSEKNGTVSGFYVAVQLDLDEPY